MNHKLDHLVAIVNHEDCHFKRENRSYKRSKCGLFFLFRQSHRPSQLCYLLCLECYPCFEYKVQSHGNTCLFGVRFQVQPLPYTTPLKYRRLHKTSVQRRPTYLIHTYICIIYQFIYGFVHWKAFQLGWCELAHLLLAVFIAAGILQWVDNKATPQSVREAKGCDSHGCLTFFDALWFMIVTVSSLDAQSNWTATVVVHAHKKVVNKVI